MSTTLPLRRPSAGVDRSGISFAELEGLPLCVARYFRRVLADGQAPVSTATVSQRGELLLRPGRHGWFPFEGMERFTARPPGFVWDARVRLAPGLRVHVVDSFLDGVGSMRAVMLGVIPLASAHGTPEIAAGALHRYLAEAVLLPTALLPRNGVTWSPLHGSAARASLSVGATTVELDFRFGQDELLESVFTPARMRDVRGRGVPTPWQGHWSEYERCEGMLIPRQGDVEWLLADGPQPYWRGRVTSLAYEWTAAGAEPAAAPSESRRTCTTSSAAGGILPMA